MSRHNKWLVSELPKLVEQGVLPAATAEALRAHYAKEESSGRNWAAVVFGVIGALLVGGGVILLLAHNWSMLSRPARTGISLLPLLLAQVAAAMVRRQWMDSLAARETVGVLWMSAVGAAIALISRTYNLPGDFGAFMLTWMLLSLPMIYLLDAATPAILYWWGLLAWAVEQQSSAGHAAGFWPLAALAVPFVAREVGRNRFGLRTAFLLAAGAITLIWAVGIGVSGTEPGMWIITYAGLFSALYLAGACWFEEAPTIWQNPFLFFGSGGALVLSYVLSWEDAWEHVARGVWWGRDGSIINSIVGALLTTILPLLAVYLLVQVLARRRWDRAGFGVMIICAVLGFGLSAFTSAGWLGAFIFNVYLLALGLQMLVTGYREGRVLLLNGGMLVIVLVAAARFFDSNFGLLAKGLAFIALGVGFFAANAVLARKKRRGA